MKTEGAPFGAREALMKIRASSRGVRINGEVSPINPALLGATQRGQMFAIALDAWTEAFDREKIIACVSANDPQAEVSEKDKYSSLKDLRKYGLILTTSYRFFDKRHTAPKPLRVFVRALGQLNDHFFSADSREHKERVSSILDNVYTPDTKLDFRPAKDKSYRLAVQNSLSGIEALMQEGEVDIEVFHDARRNLRDFMNIFELAAIIGDDPAALMMFTYLGSLNKKLGGMHDEVVQRGIRGEVVYEDAALLAKAKTRAKLQTALQALSDQA